MKTLKLCLADVESIPADIRQALINNGGGHLNHALFWELMTPEKQLHQQNWQQQSMQHLVHLKSSKQLSLQQQQLVSVLDGHGWLSTRGKLEVTSTANQDTPISEGKKPILGLDVWEHAYYVKYRNVRPDYIKAFFSVINWNKVDELYAAAKLMIVGGKNLFFSF